MSDKKPVIRLGGGGLCLPLLCIFITLKLTGQIDWSWLWVVSPLWLPLAIVLGFVACIFAIVGVGALTALLVAVASTRIK